MKHFAATDAASGAFYSAGGTDVAVADGGTGRSSHTAYAVLCGGTTSTAAQQSIASVGTAGQVLTSNGAGALPTMQAIPATAGRIVQRVTKTFASVATGSTILPCDDTIPQNTEGDLYMTADAFTPTNSNNILEVEIIVIGAANGNFYIGVGLFKDSDAGAINMTYQWDVGSGYYLNIPLKHRMIAGTTSPITFKVRAGPHGSGTFTFNGSGGARFGGGVLASSITITEVAV